MQILTLDFETFFSDEYTLSKMSTEAYIRDPRFEALGCAIRWPVSGKTQWVPQQDLRRVLSEIDWSQTGVLAHHAQFDGLILSHQFDGHPKFWFDTLSMARLLIGNHLSVGLDSLARHFNLSAKTVPYNLFRGKHWHELSDALQKQVADGCIHDVELTWQLFQILGKQFPVEEFEVIDETIKMFTEPCLQGDLNLLADVWEKEERAKSKRLIDLNVSEEQLQSADKFAELLRAEGVEPDVKDGKKGPIYAFAKTDQFMRDLMEDENDRVRGLAEARLGVKSTLLQTRAETLGWMASRGSGGSPSPMPVYLRYAGTGTLRVSGGDGANWTNFKRNSDIRKAVMAPDGYLLGPADASQIECRVCHYMAGGADEPVIQLFRNGEDPYVGLASKFYGETIYKPKKDDPREHEMSIKRGMGKQGRLMCQYGSAGPKFKATAKAGLYGPSVEISIEDAVNFVQLYRSDNPSICDSSSGYWAQCNRMMLSLYQGDYVDWGPLQVKEHKIFLPNGTYLNYESLEWHRPEPDEPHLKSFELSGYWRMKTRYGWKKMWGAKMTQNICEAVSRVIVSQAMIRIRRKGIRTLNWPYDELLLLIPDDKFAAERLEECRQEMIRPVRWLPGLPLDADASLGKRYSK